MSVNVDIFGGKLKEYAITHRSVTFTTLGCKICGKLGKVKFDLSRYGIQQVSVHVQRIGGNGKLVISGQQVEVRSKVHQIFDIDTEGHIELSRPPGGTGDVSLLGFTLLADKIDEANVSINWKDIIKKCGKYNCLRLANGKLFAGTGGYIEERMVKEIETDPPNSIHKKKGKIYFNNSCEVTNIVLRHIESKNIKSELYVSREPATPIKTPQQNSSHNITKRIGGGEIIRPRYGHQLPDFNDHILYDSSSIGDFRQFTKDKLSKQIRSNNQSFLVLKQNGVTSASISSLAPNTDYICIFHGKKLNGNGRIHVGASIESNFYGHMSEVVFSNSFSNRYVQIKTGGEAPNATQRLHLHMPRESCNGEVLIQKIIIVQDLGIDRARDGLEGRRYLPTNEVQHPDKQSVLSGLDMDVFRNDDDVYIASKKYAFYPQIQDVNYIDISIKGTIISNNISGVVWASRIKPLFKNIRIGDMRSEVSNDALLISRLGSLKLATRIWIEPFEFGAIISEPDVRAINSAQVVLSPSLSNVQSLQAKFKDKKIEQAYRPLPWVQPKPEELFKDLDFVLIFERDRKDINDLIRCWSNYLPKIVILGARGGYPDFVIPLNEYYPYEKLLFLIKKARFIIDLSDSCDYHSSILDLSNAMGKIILSTNWYVLDKQNGLLVVRTDHKDGRFVPSDAVLRMGINKAMAIPAKDIKDMSNYNIAFINQMKLLFS